MKPVIWDIHLYGCSMQHYLQAKTEKTLGSLAGECIKKIWWNITEL
jgi:hypothetical protein